MSRGCFFVVDILFALVHAQHFFTQTCFRRVASGESIVSFFCLVFDATAGATTADTTNDSNDNNYDAYYSYDYSNDMCIRCNSLSV